MTRLLALPAAVAVACSALPGCQATASRRALGYPLESLAEFQEQDPFVEDEIMAAVEPINDALLEASQCESIGGCGRRRWKGAQQQLSMLPTAAVPFSLDEEYASVQEEPEDRETVVFGMPELPSFSEGGEEPAPSAYREEAADIYGPLRVDDPGVFADSAEADAADFQDTFDDSVVPSEMTAVDSPEPVDDSPVSTDTAKTATIKSIKLPEELEDSAVYADAGDAAAVNFSEKAVESNPLNADFSEGAISGLSENVGDWGMQEDTPGVPSVKLADPISDSTAPAQLAAGIPLEKIVDSSVHADSAEAAAVNKEVGVNSSVHADSAEAAAVDKEVGSNSSVHADSAEAAAVNKEVGVNSSVHAGSAESATVDSNAGGSWWESFLRHLAFASAAQSAAMGGLFWPRPTQLSDAGEAKNAAEAKAEASPSTAVGGWAFLSSGSWRKSLAAFFDKLDQRLDEGGPLLYSEVYDYTL